MIPGSVIAAITFPGVIVHEIAHRFFADRAKVPVYEICYFRFGNPSGYVIHGEVKGLKNAFLISVGPFLINTGLCAVLTFAAVLPYYVLEVENIGGVFMLLLWVGFSAGMHAFPSNQDMENLTHEVRDAQGQGLLSIVTKGFVILFAMANALSVIWFDALYAAGVSLLLPWLFGVL